MLLAERGGIVSAHRRPGAWTKSDMAFMASLATLAVSVALSFLRIRQGATGSSSGGSKAPARSELSRRLSVNGAPPGAKRQLWTLTLTGADAVHNESLPGCADLLCQQYFTSTCSPVNAHLRLCSRMRGMHGVLLFTGLHFSTLSLMQVRATTV